MVRLTVDLSASSSKSLARLVDALRFLTTGTRLETGCRECAVWVDPESTVHYVEAWESEAAMKRRVLSSHFTSLLAVIESADLPPYVRFDFVANTRGLDYITELRQTPE